MQWPSSSLQTTHLCRRRPWVHTASAAIVVQRVRITHQAQCVTQTLWAHRTKRQIPPKHKEPSIARELFLSHTGLLRVRERRASGTHAYTFCDLPANRYAAQSMQSLPPPVDQIRNVSSQLQVALRYKATETW